ncbi:kinesin family protein [Striga asiatica]|uniref:Kinesin family protein n=1 Tax=Striga asiatica TaxID=4170 RepID=A0A5A7QEC7_STRAF|nr:kinesin family protein [Striga asiatica]
MENPARTRLSIQKPQPWDPKFYINKFDQSRSPHTQNHTHFKISNHLSHASIPLSFFTSHFSLSFSHTHIKSIETLYNLAHQTTDTLKGKMSSREKEKGVNVQVLLRCRPFSEEELRNNAPQVVTCNEFHREVSVAQNIAGKHFDRVFTFDKVFGPSAQQRDLYEQAVIPIVNEVLEGFNCTIFAYGQTGTGKTYTMEGECKRSKSGPNGELPSEAGVIPRAVKQIFDTLEGQNAEYSVKVTFLELYNEEITDLLAPDDISKVVQEDKQKKQLPLMEDGKGGVLVRGLEEEIVTSANEIFTLLERGSAKRRTAETLLNKQSSRSHSLFSITIHIKEATPEGEELIKCGKLNLVDLAGSENISRSGAREGRAREAGEINKSLLTLGRVINALVEHLGHIPYRDSKLTRLLRDSLGGRTKTCIIATVSPAVHCLEETLSTLDYAHRAKNIRNKPEVNQKMMKSTLIKDLYGEIERLKAEVYAAREKVGVYIPKERYHQEESERKAMADQIAQMGVTIENHQKQIEELQIKYDSKVQQCLELGKKLDSTQSDLNLTSKLLANTEDDLQQCQYSLRERDFIISEQKRSENALAHQACVLRADLEKSQKDNASLFLKIAREDKLNSDNRSTVNSFQSDLAQQLATLCSLLTASVSRQSEHLQCVENLCNSFLQVHDKASVELTQKVDSSRALYVSHFEALQNVVCMHKAGNNAALEELSALASSNSQCIEEFLAAEAAEAKSVLDDLQDTLTSQQGEMALLARELRQRFHASVEHLMNTSEFVHGFIDKLGEESQRLQHHATQVDEIQTKCIAEFQKAYEEQSRSEAEKLIADMTSLVTNCLHRQKEMVDARLEDIKYSSTGNKMFLDEHVSTINAITTDLKRKWQDSFTQAESSFKDNADFSAAKHCRMEMLVQKWYEYTSHHVYSRLISFSLIIYFILRLVFLPHHLLLLIIKLHFWAGHLNTILSGLCPFIFSVKSADTALVQWQKMQESLNSMQSKNASTINSHVRNMWYINEQHNAEIDSARAIVEEDVKANSEDMDNWFKSVSGQEKSSVSKILSTSKTHSETLQNLTTDHSQQLARIEQHAVDTFRQKYMDYEPIGTTPVKCEPDIPSKATIESLRAMPMEALQEEFRENNMYESFHVKESKPTLIPRAPLSQIN